MKRILAIALIGLLACPLFGQESQRGGGGGGGGQAPQRYLRSVNAFSTWDQRIPFPDLADLARDITGPSIAGAAAKEKLTMPPEAAQKATEVSIGPVTGLGVESGTMSIVISVSDEFKKAESPAKAKEYLTAVASRLQDLLEARAKAAVDMKLTRAQQLADETRAIAERMRRDAADRRKQIRQVSDRADTSAQGIRTALASLEQDQQKLAIELVGQKARQGMLQNTIKQFSDELERKIAGDPVMVELDRVIKGREQELTRVREMVKTATASKAEAIEAETRLAEARIKLLERRETAGKSAGGDLLGEMNKELLMLSINTAESEARRDYISKLLQHLHDAEPMLDELEAAVAKASEAEHAAWTAARALADIRQIMESVRRPYVTVGYSE
jgi:hypothetical protein